MGVAGWVRNLPDGRVEAIFEGEKKNVERMIEFCHNGPRMADVSDVKVEREEFQGEFADFTIKF